MRDHRSGFGNLRISGENPDARGVREIKRAQDDRIKADSFGEQRRPRIDSGLARPGFFLMLDNNYR
jgi:hypothetical protein